MPSVLATLTVVSLVGLLFWWTWETSKAGHRRTEGLLRGLAKKQEEKFLELSAAVSGLKDLNGRLVTLQDSVFRLNQTVQAEKQERLAERRRTDEYGSNNAAYSAPAFYEQPAEKPAEDGIDFPVAANSFLSRLSGQPQIIKPDPLKDMLVKDPDGRGQLVLVRDGSVQGGLLYIVPRITRFTTQQDFYNHYQQFYDCARPGAGEVWVTEPAVVDRVDGGWKLRDKGILEVKS